MSSMTSASMQAELLRTEAELAATTCKLVENEQRMESGDQRMFFLLNADRAREDFYEIRSCKNGEIRRIVMDNHAEIVFDSEGKCVTEGSGVLPEFDEISEKFLRVIPDDAAGRDYYRKLRGIMIPEAIPRDLPRAVREERKQAQRLEKEAVKQEGMQLRQTIVDNFRSQDCLERQAEIDEILQRKSEDEQEQATLQACQESLHETVLCLQKQLTEIEQKRAEEEALDRGAERKREHDGRRLAWLDRFDPSPRPSPTVQPSNSESCAVEESDSDSSTLFDECEGPVDADADINSDIDTMSVH